MLYHWNELTNNFIKPWQKTAQINANLMRHPFNPVSYLPFSNHIAANLDVFSDLTHCYQKPDFGIDSIDCDDIEVTIQEEIISKKPFCQLKHFKKVDYHKEQPKLLIVAPLSGHFASLLRGTVREMLPEHDVYITDWHDARLIPKREGNFSLDDFIDYVIDFIEEVGENTHVLAVCQPVVAALAAVSVMSEQNHSFVPASLSLMGGPIDARIDPTVPCELATKHDLLWFKKNLVHSVPFPNKGMGRKVYPGFLQLLGFISMNKKSHFNAYRKFHTSLSQYDMDEITKHRDFYNEYLAVMDLPETFYLDTIQKVFQEFQLARGVFQYRDHVVNPAFITKTALMTIEGQNDDISSPGQTAAAHKLCSSLPEPMQRHYLQQGAGHYGVFNGSKWRDQVAPEIKNFIKDFN